MRASGPAASAWRLSTLTLVVVLAATALAGCGAADPTPVATANPTVEARRSSEPTPVGTADPTVEARRTEVATRGAQVMPFDLERTTHHFVADDRGGVQTVVADDPVDTAQIAAIRAHLAAEAERFAAGDFGDPTSVHGEGMPGVAELGAAAGRLDIAYRDVEGGGEITYRTDDPGLRAALHAWFDAQVGDHGRHATADEPGGEQRDDG